jgi:ribosomal protein L23
MVGILKYPLSTEKAIGLVSRGNTLTYIVDARITKKMIKEEMEKIFNVKVSRIRTVNTATNLKKAYIKLAKGSSAEDVAKRLKLV